MTSILTERGTLPFIARSQENIIGYIIGLPLESLSKEPWARLDENYAKYNTIYTYAFVIKEEFKGNGYAKMLKKVYLNWAKKRWNNFHHRSCKSRYYIKIQRRDQGDKPNEKLARNWKDF